MGLLVDPRERDGGASGEETLEHCWIEPLPLLEVGSGREAPSEYPPLVATIVTLPGGRSRKTKRPSDPVRIRGGLGGVEGPPRNGNAGPPIETMTAPTGLPVPASTTCPVMTPSRAAGAGVYAMETPSTINTVSTLDTVPCRGGS